MVLHPLSGSARRDARGDVVKHARPALAALALVAGLLPVGGPHRAGAVTATARLDIQATVISFCSVIGNTLDFGEVSLGGGGERPQTNIRVSCTLGLPFQVGIDDGSHARRGQRRMRSALGRDYLEYELYKSLIGNDRFGDAIISQRVDGIGEGKRPVIVPVFGEILSGQNQPNGFYADHARITVYF
jgi:spore coat protein U-like protein